MRRPVCMRFMIPRLTAAKTIVAPYCGVIHVILIAQEIAESMQDVISGGNYGFVDCEFIRRREQPKQIGYGFCLRIEHDRRP
jgi:hypothetical protein